MKKINANKLAREVTLEEGGHTNLKISDVKEVMRIVFTKLHHQHNASEAMELIERY